MANKGVFKGDFADAESVFHQFDVPEADRKGVRILFAVYDQGDYEGSAFVIFKKGRKFYEVSGSHCSCYGLEGQWSPEEVLKAELIARCERNIGSYNYYSDVYTFLKEGGVN